MRLRTLSVVLTLGLLVGLMIARVASSETKVGSNVDVRTIVALKIADAEAQKLLPPVPASVDRVKKLSLRVTIPDLKKAFDGSEQIVSVTALPWYVREVSLP